MKYLIEHITDNCIFVYSASRNNDEDEQQLLGIASLQRRNGTGFYASVEIKPECIKSEATEVQKILMDYLTEKL